MLRHRELQRNHDTGCANMQFQRSADALESGNLGEIQLVAARSDRAGHNRAAQYTAVAHRIMCGTQTGCVQTTHVDLPALFDLYSPEILKKIQRLNS